FSDENAVLLNGYSFLPHKLSLGAYDFLFNDWENVVRSYGVSLFVTFFGTIIGLAMMALYAYPISRRDFHHPNFFPFIFFFPLLYNSGLVPFYIMYVQYLHMKNHIFALLMPLLVQIFFVLVIRTFFANSVPSALMESAKIDGAGEWRIFLQIVIPLSTPV